MVAKYRVETRTFKESGCIEQITTSESPLSGEQEIMRNVMYTREQQMREALIALGWTPPKEDNVDEF